MTDVSFTGEISGKNTLIYRQNMINLILLFSSDDLAAPIAEAIQKLFYQSDSSCENWPVGILTVSFTTLMLKKQDLKYLPEYQ